MKIKGIYFIVSILIIMNTSACSGLRALERGGEQESIKIGISIYDQYDPFIAGLMERFDEYAKEKELEIKKSITVEVVNASSNQLAQNDQVENFINNGCDVICVNLVDRTDPSMIIDKAKSANIPVIFFNRELVPEDLERWDKLYYVGAVALESGIMQGNIIVEACRDNFEEVDRNGDGILQYVMLEGEAGHQDAVVRTEYSVNTVIESGIQMEKLASAIANWKRAQAQTKMAQWIEEYGNKIEVVFANNDEMALGAIDALDVKNSENSWPLVVGIDGLNAALEKIRDKKMIGTVYNDEKGQAKGMLELSYALSTGKQIPEEINLIGNRYIRLPYKMIDENNVDEIQR